MTNRIGIEIDVDSNGAILSLRQLGSAGEQAGDDISNGANNATIGMNALRKISLLTKIAMVAVGVAATAMAFKFVKMGLDTAKSAEKVETQFKTLLGSAEAAKDRYAELASFAASTPFQLLGVANASKILETLTQGVLSTGEGLRMVGDASAIAGVAFQELAVTVGRAYSGLKSNRAIGESLARLQELGLVTGETRTEIENLQKIGKGKEAWVILQTEMKKTEGGMEELSKTFEGKTSTLIDNLGLLSASMLDSSGSMGILGQALDFLNEKVATLSNNHKNAIIQETKLKDLNIAQLKVRKELTAETMTANKVALRVGKLTTQERGFLIESIDNKKKELNVIKSLISAKELEIQVAKDAVTVANAEKERLRLIEEKLFLIRKDAEFERVLSEKKKEYDRTEILSIREYNKELNIMLGLHARESAISEESNALDQFTFQAQLKQDLTSLDQTAFEQKMSLIQQETDAQLLQASEIYDNKVELDEAVLQISEITAKKQLKLEQTKNSAIQDSSLQLANNLLSLQQAVFGQNKIASIAQAVINTSVGVTKAFAQGGTLGFITGAGIATAGATQIATISKQKFADGGYISGAGTNRSDSIDARVSNGEFIVNAQSTENNREVLEAINKGGSANSQTVSITINAGIGTDIDALAQAVTDGLQRAKKLGLEPAG